MSETTFSGWWVLNRDFSVSMFVELSVMMKFEYSGLERRMSFVSWVNGCGVSH